ncbi:MAG: hypothetical protein JWQ66_3019, partial [Mucilaginibacter sp.]|nr:hypothetical protein [Mucilaginibacter sp.]
NFGEPNIPGHNEVPDQQKTGEEKKEHTPNPQQSYQEGTADNDGQQSNKSNDNSGRDDEKEHIET